MTWDSSLAGQRVGNAALRAFNGALSLVDPLFLKKAEAGTGPLFVVGAPRSGTTLTYQVLTQQLRVAYFTPVMNYLFGIPNIVARALQRVATRPRPVFESRYGRTEGWLAPAENGNFWFRWFPRDGPNGHWVQIKDVNIDDFASLTRTIDSISAIFEKPFIFKSVYLGMAIGVLAELFPEARFVWVRRQRLLTCQSLLRARQQRKNTSYWWSVKSPGYRELLHLPLWQQVAEQVIGAERVIAQDLHQLQPHRFREVHYEQLCRDPRGVVGQLADWLSAAAFAQYADSRLPNEFPVSEKISLPDDIANTLSAYLSQREKD